MSRKSEATERSRFKKILHLIASVQRPFSCSIASQTSKQKQEQLSRDTICTCQYFAFRFRPDVLKTLTGSTAVLFFLIHNACQRQGLEIIYETIIKIIMQLLEVTSKGNALLQGEFIYL